MDRITQETHNRQRMLKYLEKHSVTETVIPYKISRKTIWKWRKRYDGTLESLKERSRRPHHMPRWQQEEEVQLVKQLHRRYESDLILAYQKACEQGYGCSYGCFKHTVLADESAHSQKSEKKPKAYERAAMYCSVTGQKYYQYTAKDECSRWPYRGFYDEHSTYSSFQFLKSLIKAAPFPIRRIQTDNGTEFTNALVSGKSDHATLFESASVEYGIEYQRIRIGTPQHNGKVERQHRLDEMCFY